MTLVQVNEPGVEVTMYEVMAAPPVLDGAVHDTRTCVAPKTPTTSVGEPGTEAGTTGSEAVDAVDTATTLRATTRNT